MILFYKTGEMFVEINKGMVYVIVRDTNSVFNKRLAVTLSSRKKTTMYTAMSDFYRELFILKMSCFHSRDKVKYINSERKSGWWLCCLGNIIFLLVLRLELVLLNCPHQIHTAKNSSVECLHE